MLKRMSKAVAIFSLGIYIGRNYDVEPHNTKMINNELVKMGNEDDQQRISENGERAGDDGTKRSKDSS